MREGRRREARPNETNAVALRCRARRFALHTRLLLWTRIGRVCLRADFQILAVERGGKRVGECASERGRGVSKRSNRIRECARKLIVLFAPNALNVLTHHARGAAESSAHIAHHQPVVRVVACTVAADAALEANECGNILAQKRVLRQYLQRLRLLVAFQHLFPRKCAFEANHIVVPTDLRMRDTVVGGQQRARRAAAKCRCRASRTRLATSRSYRRAHQDERGRQHTTVSARDPE